MSSFNNESSNNSSTNAHPDETFPLYTVFKDDSIPIEEKMSLLTRFKGHVKKELVNESSIQAYFAALLFISGHYAYHSYPRLIFLSHSSLCYLIKRVAMQSPVQFNDTLVEQLLNHLIFQLPNEKKFWLASIKAIEAIYLVNPSKIQTILAIFLQRPSDNQSEDYLNRIKSTLLTIDELIQINERNNSNHLQLLRFFMLSFTNLLNNNLNEHANEDNNNIIIELIFDIMYKYLKLDDENLINGFISDLEVEKFKQKFISLTKSLDQHDSQEEKSSLFHEEYEFQLLLTEAKLPQLSNNLSSKDSSTKKNYESLNQLQQDLENLLVPFQNIKETEQNWKLRQSNIIELDNIISGNVPKNNPEEFVTIMKEVQLIELISRATSSLRTTLSLTALLFLKKLIHILNDNLSLSILDQIFVIFKNLLSSTKKISSQTAFHCLITLIIDINHFHNKLFQLSFLLINEKTVTPRFCSAILLRSFLVKFNDSNLLFNNSNTVSPTSKLENNLIYIEEWLKKGISDSQTTVREAMRLTFWYFYKCYPTNAKKLLSSTFTPQLKKATELAIPAHLNINYLVSRVSSTASASSTASRLYSQSSNNSSRGASLLEQKKNFPSYAQPTKSSSTSLVNGPMAAAGNNVIGSKISNKFKTNLRSTSEYSSKENEKRARHHDSLNTATSIDTKDNGNPIKRKVSAPPSSSITTKPTENYANLDDFMSNQIDLTDELSNSYSNPLIKKYLDKNDVSISSSPISLKAGNKSGEYETLYKKFNDASLSSQFKDVLQYLQKELLSVPQQQSSSPSAPKFEFSKISKKLRQIMVKSPHDLKLFLNIPKFINEFPPKYLLELYSINDFDYVETLKNKMNSESSSEITNLITLIVELFNFLNSNNCPADSKLYYMKYKTSFFNYNFKLLLQIFRDSNSKNDSTLRPDILDLMPKISLSLFQIYGREFDYTCYFDLIFEIYKFDKERFNKLLTDFDIVSTKMKICHELEKKDANFKLENIISRESSVNFTPIDDKKFNRGDELDEVVDENDVKKYMEMTMINPFNLGGDKTLELKNNVNPERAPITNSVVIHDDDEKDKKLSEMTKIVSVYQLDQSNSVNEEEDQDMEASPKSDLNLSEIFQNGSDNAGRNLKDDNEPTVKFSTEPPKIINEPGKRTENENENEKPNFETMSPIKIEEDENVDQKQRITVKREREQALTEQDINSKKMKVVSIKKSEKARCSIIDHFPKDSLTIYEISHLLMVDSIGNISMDIDVYFSHMLKAINRIKSGSFTMKHINYLIEPLISCFQNQKMTNWLLSENGFDELLAVAIMLLKSTDDTPSIPSKISSKSIILVHSLLVWKNFLNKDSGNADADGVSLRMSFEGVWEQILLMLNKLSDYGNEIYKLVQEFRDNLMLSHYFKKHSATRILSMLVTEIEPDTAGVKETFLIDTLSKMLLSPTIRQQFKKSNLSEIIQTMSYFITGSENTSWNFTSAMVLAQSLRLLQAASDCTEQETERLFDCLPKDVFKMIVFIASNE